MMCLCHPGMGIITSLSPRKIWALVRENPRFSQDLSKLVTKSHALHRDMPRGAHFGWWCYPPAEKSYRKLKGMFRKLSLSKVKFRGDSSPNSDPGICLNGATPCRSFPSTLI